jgi:hypothetical protein
MEMKVRKNDTRRQFFRHKMCSHTMFFIINREYENLHNEQERASDPLVGGIMQCGYQCGLLFGAVMGAGKQAFRICNGDGHETALAIVAAREINEAFVNTCGNEDCREIIGIDWKNRWQTMKHTLTNGLFCFNLSQRWGPVAIRAVKEGLESDIENLPNNCTSCASIVAKKMGANDEEAAIVAGFAGGIGLSGKACGALSAAIWMKSLKWCRETPRKTPFQNKYSKETWDAFSDFSKGKFLCMEITGMKFNTPEEHTRFLQEGGCAELMEFLSKT